MKQLRPYQVEAVEDLRAGIKAGHKKQVLAASTGFGKSIVAMHLIHSSLQKAKRCMFLVDRRVLVDQFSNHLQENGIEHGVLMANHWRWRPWENVQVASVQTLERMESIPIFDLIIIDEIHACFPAGTLVDGVPIESIKVGDYVDSFNHSTGMIEKKMVTSVFQHHSRDLVRVATDSGASFVCTANHPVFANGEYVRADMLTHNSVLQLKNQNKHEVISNAKSKEISIKDSNDLRMLQGGFSSRVSLRIDSEEKGDACFLPEGSLHPGTERIYPSVEQREYEAEAQGGFARKIANEQPNEKSRNSGEGSIESFGKGCEASKAGREWSWDDEATSDTSGGVGEWVGSGIYSFDREEEGERISYGLQDRYSQRAAKNSYRGGWEQSQYGARQRAGHAQEYGSFTTRVVSVEVQEQAGTGTSGGYSAGSEFTPVFNIEVEGNHNYYANGVLVHNCMRASVCKLLEHTGAVVIGLTATPFNGKLSAHFSRISNTTTMRQLVEMGSLVPFRVFAAQEIDVSGLKAQGDSWESEKLEERALAVIGDVVSEYTRISNDVWGGPRKTIVFSSGVQHGKELAQRFAEAGYNFLSISYMDDEETKKAILEDFARPDTSIQGLISTDILTRGFDVTDVEHVILAQPLRKAFSKFVQMIGRGARSHPGKEFCVVQCHSGNWLRFQKDWEELYCGGVAALPENPDEAKRKERTEKEKEAAKCPRCKQIWQPQADVCSFCGHVRERMAGVAEVAGVMVEISEPPAPKYDSATKERWFQELLKYARSTGKKDGWAFYKYQDKFGLQPTWKKTEAQSVSDEVRGWITSQNIRKAKGMKYAR